MKKQNIAFAVAAAAVAVALIPATGKATTAPQQQPGNSTLVNIFTSQIGVKEDKGKNRGTQIDTYNKNAKTALGNAWCSSFIKWCLDMAGIANKVNAWSPTAYNAKNVVYANGKFLKPLQPGDVFTLHNGTRIFHAGFVLALDGSNIITVEGNTNSGGSPDGDGVYKRSRKLSSIHNISRWV